MEQKSLVTTELVSPKEELNTSNTTKAEDVEIIDELSEIERSISYIAGREHKTRVLAPRKPGEKLVELPIHQDAFKYWVALDDVRTLTKVAKRLGTSTKTISLWAKRFNWKDRLAEIQLQDDKIGAITPYDEVIKTKKQVVALVKALLDEAGTYNRQKGTIKLREDLKIKSVKDLHVLIMAYREILGEKDPVSVRREDSALNQNTQINLIIKK